jgi:hypothetical protein
MGGPTCLTNLISLCDQHHWLVHEGGYALAIREPGQWVLLGPGGIRVGPHPEVHEPSAPLPIDPDVKPDAVTGRWDGSVLDSDPIIYAVLTPRSERATKPDAATENVSADTSAVVFQR